MMIALVWNVDSINNTELQQMLGMNSLEVGKLLHQMVVKQLLSQDNKNRWTTYSILRSSDKKEKSDKKGDKKEVLDNKENRGKGKSDKKSEEKKKIELTRVEKQILELIKQDICINYEALA